MNCPLTGKPCNEKREFTISEHIEEFTHTTQCCRCCAVQWISLRNNSITPTPPVQVTDEQVLEQIISQVTGKPVIVQKIGNVSQAHIVRCPKCKCGLAEIRKMQKLGCDDCYNTFGSEITSYLPKIQNGGTTHIGKVPKSLAETPVESPPVVLSSTHEKEVAERLQKQMKSAIAAEDYLEAAKCRDLIRRITKDATNG